MINEIKVVRNSILVIVEQQYQIVGTQETIHKDRSTKILDLKRAENEEYEIYSE